MGQILFLEAARVARGLPPAVARGPNEQDERDGMLKHYSERVVLPKGRNGLRALCVHFCSKMVKTMPSTPPWTRFFFFRMPMSPKLYSRLSFGANAADESWWVLDPVTDTAQPLSPAKVQQVDDSGRPIFSLPMSEFFRL